MIRQVIVIRSEDFPGALPHHSAAKAKSPGGDEKFLLGVEDSLRKLLGDYKGPLKVLGIPSLDAQVRLTQTPRRDLPALERLVFSVAIPDLPGDGPDVEGLKDFRKVSGLQLENWAD